MNQFFILLYKDFILRKRHYMITLCELLSPIFFSCVPLVLLLVLDGKPKFSVNKTFEEYYNELNVSSWPPVKPITYDLENPFEIPSEFYVENSTIHLFYTPVNWITTNIMENALKLFQIEAQFDHLALRGFSNESELNRVSIIYGTYPEKVIGSIFNDIKEEFPSGLNYTIRCRDSNSINTFKTDEVLKYQNTKLKPYKDSVFLAWQTALEQAFIKLKAGKEKKYEYKVYLHEFPVIVERYSVKVMHLLDLWPLIFSFGFLIFAAILTYRITMEKDNGMQVLMNSMGLTQFTYWISAFTCNFLPAVIVSFIITLIYKNPPAETMFFFLKTDFYVLWLFVLVFITNSILYCFVISIFFDKSRYAAVFVILLYLVTFSLLFFPYYYGPRYTFYMNLSYGLKLFICIVPMSSVFYSFQLLFVYELSGKGVTWSSIIKYEDELYFDLSYIVYGNMMSFFILIILLWYLDAVWPFQGRIPQPIYFPFTVNYWFGSHFCVKRITNEDLESDMNLDSEFYEPIFDTTYPTIVVQNVTKWFDLMWSSSTVINELSFKIYSGKITLLLGRKNSGKTTLFKMISGLLKPNNGKVFINGFDLYSSLSEVRSYLGICPENCVLYETLTVHEHLQIFAGILLLDEPTKDMSSDTRYHFWSALRRLKRNRTIFMTSSSVHDVYNFADRIALFSHGQLLCCGSLNFLNEILDVGYKLHIAKDYPCEVDEILNIIQKYYRQATLEKETNNCVTVNLKSVINVRLSTLFEELECVGEKIGIKSCGIIMVPLEDVFMNESYITFLKSKDSELVSSENSSDKDVQVCQRYLNTSWSLFFSRLCALFYKRSLYMLRLWGLFVLHLLIPLVLISITFVMLHCYHFSSFSPLYLNLHNIYGKNIYGFIEAHNSKFTNPKSVIQNELLAVMEENQVSVFSHTNVETLLNLYSVVFFPHYSSGLLIGGSIYVRGSSPLFVAWYNSKHYHTAPIALNFIHTAILRHLTGNGSFCLSNHPFPCNSIISCASNVDSHKIIILTVIPLVAAFIGASGTFIPVYERTSKAKLLQLMSGLSVNLYWLSMLLWDILIHFGVCLSLILAAYVLHPYHMTDPGSFGAMYLVFFSFGWCAIPISYLMSLVCDRPIDAFVYLFLFYAVSGFISIIVEVPKIYIPCALFWIFSVFPSYAVTEGLLKIFLVPVNNTFCYGLNDEVLDVICSRNDKSTKISPYFKCCHNICGDECEDYIDYFSFDPVIGILAEVLIMFFIGSLLLLLLKLLEAAMYQSYKGCVYAKPVDEELSRKDNDVISCGVYSERERIADAIASGSHDETLMVLDLTKYYGSLCAVNNLTFGVNVGESLGIVGRYGAGKSSLFKMIAGELNPTAGNTFIKEYNLVNNLKEFQTHVGYCPQYDALLNHLTGEEMLKFISTLRGVIEEDLLPILTEMMEIENFANKLIKHYSFAEKRKVAVITAAIGSKLVLIIDEPTTGIDFKSKKIIWNMLNKIKNCNLIAIVFSCTSILECQKLNQTGLCTKLAVIDHGTFQCIGSIEKLEEKYNTGKIVKIIIKQEGLDFTCIFKAKGFFESTVPKTTLLTYNQGTFTYHVGESFLTLSSLFHIMDFMKIKFHLHHYLINDSSLNNVCQCYTEET